MICGRGTFSDAGGRPEVKGMTEHPQTVCSRVWPRRFRACAKKNSQYNAYLWPNRRNSRVLKEIGMEEHGGDVRL